METGGGGGGSVSVCAGLIPAESTVETLSIVVETKVSEANCRFFSPSGEKFF